jgi:hypothetical protein
MTSLTFQYCVNDDGTICMGVYRIVTGKPCAFLFWMVCCKRSIYSGSAYTFKYPAFTFGYNSNKFPPCVYCDWQHQSVVFQFTTRHLQEFSEHLQRNNRSILSVVVMQFSNISYRAWGSIFIFYVSTSGYSKDSASFSARILCCILRFLILSENKDIAILL